MRVSEGLAWELSLELIEELLIVLLRFRIIVAHHNPSVEIDIFEIVGRFLGNFELGVFQLVEVVGQVRELVEDEVAGVQVLLDAAEIVAANDVVFPEEAVLVAGSDDTEPPYNHWFIALFCAFEFNAIDIDLVVAIWNGVESLVFRCFGGFKSLVEVSKVEGIVGWRK